MGAPVSTVVNPVTKQHHKCAYWANESGGSTASMFLLWLKSQFRDTTDENGMPLGHYGPLFKVSRYNPVVVLLDGHCSHWSLEVLEYCVANGIHLVLRPPHTSHVSQGEDVINFLRLKSGIWRVCCEKLVIRAMSVIRGASGTPEAVSLSNADLMECIKGPGHGRKLFQTATVSRHDGSQDWHPSP
jgi:hypothetical protein